MKTHQSVNEQAEPPTPEEIAAKRAEFKRKNEELAALIESVRAGVEWVSNRCRGLDPDLRVPMDDFPHDLDRTERLSVARRIIAGESPDAIIAERTARHKAR
jgi:hypothetical protein